MDQPPFQTENRNFLAAWRQHRGLKQQQLADAIGTSGSVISELESGRTKLSPKWLRRIAPVLRTTPGHLLDYHPDEVDDDLLEIWRAIPEDQREQALIILKTFARAA
jgi:transcriptional regulator with XRE-family HTH domain